MATEATGAAAEAPGMPQLDFSTFPNQIFWLVLTLVAIYFILQRVALPRIESVLAERQGTITNDLATAEDLKQKAGEAEEAYKQALADARAEAQKIIAESKAEMQAELDEAIKKADAEIAARTAESERAISEIRASAMSNVETVAKDTAAEIISALGQDAEQSDIDKAVKAQMGNA